MQIFLLQKIHYGYLWIINHIAIIQSFVGHVLLFCATYRLHLKFNGLSFSVFIISRLQ